MANTNISRAIQNDNKTKSRFKTRSPPFFLFLLRTNNLHFEWEIKCRLHFWYLHQTHTYTYLLHIYLYS